MALGAAGGENILNCCDEYGNCRQGRDCPARKQMLEKKQENVVGILLTIFACICALALVILFWRS